MFSKLLNAWVHVELMGHLAIWGRVVLHEGPVVLIAVPDCDGDESHAAMLGRLEIVNLAGPALYRLATTTQAQVLAELSARRPWSQGPALLEGDVVDDDDGLEEFPF